MNAENTFGLNLRTIRMVRSFLVNAAARVEYARAVGIFTVEFGGGMPEREIEVVLWAINPDSATVAERNALTFLAKCRAGRAKRPSGNNVAWSIETVLPAVEEAYATLLDEGCKALHIQPRSEIETLGQVYQRLVQRHRELAGWTGRDDVVRVGAVSNLLFRLNEACHALGGDVTWRLSPWWAEGDLRDIADAYESLLRHLTTAEHALKARKATKPTPPPAQRRVQPAMAPRKTVRDARAS